jgi:hypothetical protein
MLVTKLFRITCIGHVHVTQHKDPKEALLCALLGASRWQFNDNPPPPPDTIRSLSPLLWRYRIFPTNNVNIRVVVLCLAVLFDIQNLVVIVNLQDSNTP